MTDNRQPSAPLSEAVIVALSKAIDDAGKDRRDPSHSDLGFLIERVGLSASDPARQGQTVGKAKRVRAVLTRALEDAPNKGERLVAGLVSTIRGCGGFRQGSPNYVGDDAVADLAAAFAEEGAVLSSDGVLTATVLDSLGGRELTDALRSYVRRAKRGVEDAALLVGTGKDLLEATAKHVIVERMNTAPRQMDFPTLLGQAFYALSLATPADSVLPGEHPRRRLERALYEAGCSVNALRNRDGTGHGRPWLPTVTNAEARAAVEIMGVVAEYLLRALRPANAG